MKTQGIPTPPDGTAVIITEPSSTAFIKGPREFIDLVTPLFTSNTGCFEPTSVRTQIILVSLLASDLSPLGPPDFDQLYSKYGQSWKVISTLETLSRSGQRASATAALKNETGQPFSGELLSTSRWGVQGTIFEQEMTLGYDGASFDANCAYHFRGAGDGKEPAEFKYAGTMAGGLGKPQVVQFVNGGPTAPSYALIIRVDNVMPGGHLVPPNSPID